MNNLQLIEKVLYYIDEHIYEELTYERLAEVSGYSSFYFHKIFSSVTKASHIKGFKGKWEYPWVVTYHGEVIGQIQLFNFFNHNTCAEVGYFIKKTYWNHGINTKVLKAVCRFGIETMGLERIEAFAHVDNMGSNRTLQKAGFVKEGTLRKRFEVKGELYDCNVYSFVKDNL